MSTDATDTDISTAEKAVMVISVGFTVTLFGFAIAQALMAPGPAEPTVVIIDERPASDGDVIYTVELRNHDDVGLVSATVEAACTDPPAELRFQNIPASGTREGSVVCPPGTRDPALSVTTWVVE